MRTLPFDDDWEFEQSPMRDKGVQIIAKKLMTIPRESIKRP